MKRRISNGKQRHKLEHAALKKPAITFNRFFVDIVREHVVFFGQGRRRLLVLGIVGHGAT